MANKIARNGKGRDFFTHLLSSADISGKYKRLTNVFPDKAKRDRVIVFDDTPGTKAAYTERKHFVRVPTWDGVKQDTVLDTLCAAIIIEVPRCLQRGNGSFFRIRNYEITPNCDAALVVGVLEQECVTD